MAAIKVRKNERELMIVDKAVLAPNNNTNEEGFIASRNGKEV
jgi:hypothetical protein